MSLFKFFSIVLLFNLFFLNCNNEKENNSTLGILLYLSSQKNSYTGSEILSTEQEEQKIQVVSAQTAITNLSKSISAAVSSQVNASGGSFNAQNDLPTGLEEQRLMADILQNGRDPYFAGELVKKYVQDKYGDKFVTKSFAPKKSSVNLAALSGTTKTYTRTVNSDGSITYNYSTNFSGTQNGISYTGGSFTGSYLRTYFNMLYGSIYSTIVGCTLDNLTYYIKNGNQGSVSISNGSYTNQNTTPAITVADFTNYKRTSGGSSSFEATLSFSNYGTIYGDPASLIKIYQVYAEILTKKWQDLTCDNWKALAKLIGPYSTFAFEGTNASTINSGTIQSASTSTNQTSNTYQNNATANTITSSYTITGSTTSSTKSTDLVINGVSTPMDVIYSSNITLNSSSVYNKNAVIGPPTATSSITGPSQNTITGSLTIAISGTIAGTPVSINQVISF